MGDLQFWTTWVIGPVLAFYILAFVLRIVLTWYPQVPLRRFPLVLIYLPTEPFLAPTRRLVPPLGGVDITPVIWVGIVSFLREILLGQQGILTLLLHQG
ncbi:MAG: YggT family protein [Gloeomargarita sp. SKYG116]|nr:YggT family protein [Gloeomargarita sp. SKYG98]MCS7031632.1 YggT family protein [Gloeomargarita sp. SKYG116]MCS7291543.1 YggT family protein [Gloeomargarita sp. SKYB120]MDW8177103.1 YggT family protein [Gloeomargarita sp. SKYBB_i_bin120]MDW8401800.1 YggT family protein [Gloeomargarita sp. SKYGB_i_bin116]